MEELERTMALLAFDDTTVSPVGDLLHSSQRQRTASELNAAILTSQSQEKDPKLPSMLKMLVWAQDELDEKAIFPRMKNLVTAELVDVNNNNGNNNTTANNNIINNNASTTATATANTNANNNSTNNSFVTS